VRRRDAGSRCGVPQRATKEAAVVPLGTRPARARYGLAKHK